MASSAPHFLMGLPQPVALSALHGCHSLSGSDIDHSGSSNAICHPSGNPPAESGMRRRHVEQVGYSSRSVACPGFAFISGGGLYRTCAPCDVHFFLAPGGSFTGPLSDAASLPDSSLARLASSLAIRPLWNSPENRPTALFVCLGSSRSVSVGEL